MRSDMSKVLTTSSRSRTSVKNPMVKKLRHETKLLGRDPELDVGVVGRCSLRVPHSYLKDERSGRIRPLLRFLETRIGQAWDAVYSELRAVFHNGSEDAMQLLTAYVKGHTFRAADGTLYAAGSCGTERVDVPSYGRYAFFIDPDGILRKSPPRIRRKRTAPVNQRKLSETEYLLRREDGQWFRVIYAPVVQAPPRADTWEWLSYQPTPGLKTTLGLRFPEVKDHYPHTVRTLNRRELKDFGLA